MALDGTYNTQGVGPIWIFQNKLVYFAELIMQAHNRVIKRIDYFRQLTPKRKVFDLQQTRA